MSLRISRWLSSAHAAVCDIVTLPLLGCFLVLFCHLKFDTKGIGSALKLRLCNGESVSLYNGWGSRLVGFLSSK